MGLRFLQASIGNGKRAEILKLRAANLLRWIFLSNVFKTFTRILLVFTDASIPTVATYAIFRLSYIDHVSSKLLAEGQHSFLGWVKCKSA